MLTLTGLSEQDAFALLDAGLEAGILIVSGARYRFRHELVRQALVEQVPPHHRIGLHRDAARRLAAAGAAPALIARHRLDGGRPDEAVDWLLAAARRAITLGAFADALGHLEALLDHVPDHAGALCLRAEALDALGDSGAPAAYAAAARVVGEPAAHEIRAKQALAQLKLGDPAGALRTLEDPERVTVAFLVCVAAAEQGRPTMMFLTKEAVRLALPGVAVGTACDGCPPLPELLDRYERAGGRCLVCPICFQAKKLDSGQLIAGAEIGGTVPLWQWIGDEAATTFSY